MYLDCPNTQLSLLISLCSEKKHEGRKFVFRCTSSGTRPFKRGAASVNASNNKSNYGNSNNKAY